MLELSVTLYWIVGFFYTKFYFSSNGLSISGVLCIFPSVCGGTYEYHLGLFGGTTAGLLIANK